MGTRRRRAKKMAITVFLTGRATRIGADVSRRLRRRMLRVSGGRGLAVPARARQGMDSETRLPPRAQTKRNGASENFHSAHAVQVGRHSDEVCGFLARRSKGNVHRAAQLRLAAFL